MARQRIETGSSFEFDSFWRVADGSDGAEDAQGRLTYDPARGIELAVVDLRTERPYVFESHEEIPVLHGHDLQGKPCTVFDAIATKVEGNLFGGHIREVLTSIGSSTVHSSTRWTIWRSETSLSTSGD